MRTDARHFWIQRGRKPRGTKFQANWTNLEKSKKLQILTRCNFFVNRDTSTFDMRNERAERHSTLVS